MHLFTSVFKTASFKQLSQKAIELKGHYRRYLSFRKTIFALLRTEDERTKMPQSLTLVEQALRSAFDFIETMAGRTIAALLYDCNHPLLAFTKHPQYEYLFGFETEMEELFASHDYLGLRHLVPKLEDHDYAAIQKALDQVHQQYPCWQILRQHYFQLKKLHDKL